MNKMAKDYLCKDCNHNNNGWCIKHEKQGLKLITDCKDKISKNNALKDTEVQDEEINTMPYKVYGKVEMLYLTMKQVIGIEQEGKDTISINELKELLVNLADMLTIEEQIHGIETDYMVEEDILKAKHNLTERWRTNG